MRITITILFICFCFCFSSKAQQNSFIKYFDSTWNYCAKENASFYTLFEKIDTAYKCTSYYMKSNKLYGKSTFADTLFKRGIGLMVRYYENGRTKDSSFYATDSINNWAYQFSYYPNGNIEDSIFLKGDNTFKKYHYYENGKLFAYGFYDKDKDTILGEGYDETGKAIPNFIFYKKAEFSGGPEKWSKYLERNLKSNVPARKKAPIGRYSVIVLFTIDKEGKITDVIALNDPGYGAKEEAIRVVKQSPIWIPAIEYNKPSTFSFRQAITFQVSNE